MKNILLICILISIKSLTLMTQCQTQTEDGRDLYFNNPIFSGDSPDPSILIDGNNYYVVHSSFYYYPGLTIWHSNDLINWTPITSTLYTYMGSVWAPDLAKHNGRFYIYFPADNIIYVISADSITGPWSEPVKVIEGFIDPDHFVDKEGNRYLYLSGGSYVPLSDDGLLVTGKPTDVYDGWPIPREWTIECFCMEGPEIAKRGDYYYKTVAQGGTAGPATGHMVIAARSTSPLGPWENSPFNPIIRAQADTDTWWSVGHGSIFEDAEGNWHMMFHGYQRGHQNLGRQTLLVPIEWTEDGWFKIPEHIEIDKPIKKPKGIQTGESIAINYDFKINKTLNPRWKFFGEYDTNRFSLVDNSIEIKGKGNLVGQSSPLLFMPTHHSYIAEVELNIEGNATGGLVLFYNERAYTGILADSTNILANLRGWQFITESNVMNRNVFLRLKNVNNTVDMYYSLDGQNWTKIENSAEVSAFHHNILSGFLSLRIGLTAVGDGKVKFQNFTYSPLN